MKKVIVCTIVSFFYMQHTNAQIFLGKSGDISFFSKSPIENIEAHNEAAKPVLNSTTGEILFKIPVTSFIFKSSLMQEHFNENYMESDKFPVATLQGKISEAIDYTKNAENKVTVTGVMNVHGVNQNVTLPGLLTVKDNTVMIDADFKLNLADYEIKVPALYSQTIASDIDVKVHQLLVPYVRK